MAAVAKVDESISEVTLLKLAREIAMDIQPLQAILKSHQISPETWSYIKDTPRFLWFLKDQMATWEGALNTHERVKLKAAAMLEEWLPELNNRIHDGHETLPAKIEAGKLLTKMAGIGERAAAAEGGGGGERFSVTINLGADTQLKFDKELPIKVIDHEPAPE